jgi:hypothetical protein
MVSEMRFRAKKKKKKLKKNLTTYYLCDFSISILLVVLGFELKSLRPCKAGALPLELHLQSYLCDFGQFNYHPL